jgi:hypothetical protein
MKKHSVLVLFLNIIIIFSFISCGMKKTEVTPLFFEMSAGSFEIPTRFLLPPVQNHTKIDSRNTSPGASSASASSGS